MFVLGVLKKMSISTKSYESIILLAKSYYNEYAPLYFTDDHVEITCDIILLLLQTKTIRLVKTMIILLEPIVENDGVVYISIPLLAKLINAPIEMPNNKVEIVSKEFDIFESLKFGIELEKSKNEKCFYSDETVDEFTPHQRIRFTHMIRIAFMCSHFFQHYSEKIPYTTHNSSLNHLEMAAQKIKAPISTTIIDYSKLSNY